MENYISLLYYMKYNNLKGALIGMDYAQVGKSWFTKYRPKSEEDYCGDSIKKVIAKRFVKKEDFPHVLFISGLRGCGKTTFCRLIAKRYLCLHPHEDGSPCDECEMCESINEILIGGESTQVECPGVVEVDATIANGKEAIQEVMDEALQPPVYGDLKVLIMDECHMFSKAAQNSLLKLIEDIPPHLVVMFATTDPQNVLDTIKSRCQLMLEVGKQSIKDMSRRLKQISVMEGLIVSDEALEIIAKKGDRVPRECINLLEAIAKTYDKQVTIDNVRDYIGGDMSDRYVEFYRAANSENIYDLLKFVRGLRENNIRQVDFIRGLLKFTVDALYIKNGIAIDEYPVEYIEAVKELFNTYTINQFDMLLQVVEQLSNQIKAEDTTDKFESSLITTGMRISKIDMLAKGLVSEQLESDKENKESLYKHSQILKRDNAAISEKLKVDLGIEEIADSFGSVEPVENTSGLFEDIDVPELKPVEEKVEQVDNNDTIEDNVDDFFG